jgi:AcrR family transcriptional regulator
MFRPIKTREINIATKPAAAKTRTKKAAETKVSTVKDELLDAAIELLQEAGPQGATARAICDLVGVKQPSLYHHYGQLEKLHQEAVTAVFQRVAHLYSPASPLQTPEQSIRHSWQMFIHFCHQNPLLFSFINEQLVKGKLPDFVGLAFQQLVDDLIQLGQGQPLALPPFQAAELLWAGANGAATLAAAAHNRGEVDLELADVLLDALLAYLMTKPVAR